MHASRLLIIVLIVQLPYSAHIPIAMAAEPAAATSGSASFTGQNARVSVNGDLVQARQGILTVNGVPYGTVNETSVVKYTVRDGEKLLLVDGVPRKPEQK
ncbi:MAG: hypothetical protein JWQ23_1271 [Herminiimonas sp.]|nr:hypothetical protein [Herminiimonas sp.]